MHVFCVQYVCVCVFIYICTIIFIESLADLCMYVYSYVDILYIYMDMLSFLAISRIIIVLLLYCYSTKYC